MNGEWEAHVREAPYFVGKGCIWKRTHLVSVQVEMSFNQYEYVMKEIKLTQVIPICAHISSKLLSAHILAYFIAFNAENTVNYCKN